jgi:catechol 2,3-dioxygenase-like lactoylglutathione lyase family enzyme
MNLNQITIPVLDLERSIAFYQTLGLQLIVHSNDHYARFVCPDGGTTFSVHLVTEMPSGDGIWIYFEVENVAEEVTKLETAGIVFEVQATDQPWLWHEARLKDPDGNQLLIYHAGENRLNPPWRLS